MNITIENLYVKNIDNNPGSGIFKKEVNFEEKSKILLTGTSGSGKTTFISILYGLYHDFSGNIIFRKRNIKTFKDKHWVNLRQKKLSLVFQDLKLFSDLTGHENIIIKNNLTNFKNTEQIKSILKELGISRIADKKIANMSFGEKQRFALARSLMQPFSWLILDEPFSHLDNNNRDKACRLIEKECKARNAGIILADHDDENLFDFDLRLNL